MPKLNAANCPELARVKKFFNEKIYKHALEIMNQEGTNACRGYIGSFFNEAARVERLTELFGPDPETARVQAALRGLFTDRVYEAACRALATGGIPACRSFIAPFYDENDREEALEQIFGPNPALSVEACPRCGCTPGDGYTEGCQSCEEILDIFTGADGRRRNRWGH